MPSSRWLRGGVVYWDCCSLVSGAFIAYLQRHARPAALQSAALSSSLLTAREFPARSVPVAVINEPAWHLAPSRRGAGLAQDSRQKGACPCAPAFARVKLRARGTRAGAPPMLSGVCHRVKRRARELALTAPRRRCRAARAAEAPHFPAL